MPDAGRYMVGQKLSDYQFENILRAFANGTQASAVVAASRGRKGSRAPNTVSEIYLLVRKRLMEIGYFPDPIEYWREMNSEEARHYFPFSDAAQRIADQEDRLRGTTEETAIFHLSEIIFRAENPELRPEAIYREIRDALRTTGPLNRPPRNLEIWARKQEIAFCRREIDRLRALKRREINGELIQSIARLLAGAEARLRKMQRDRRTRSSPVRTRSKDD